MTNENDVNAKISVKEWREKFDKQLEKITEHIISFIKQMSNQSERTAKIEQHLKDLNGFAKQIKANSDDIIRIETAGKTAIKIFGILLTLTGLTVAGIGLWIRFIK